MKDDESNQVIPQIAGQAYGRMDHPAALRAADRLLPVPPTKAFFPSRTSITSSTERGAEFHRIGRHDVRGDLRQHRTVFGSADRLTACLTGVIMRETGNIWLGMAACVCVATLSAAMNAALISYGRINAVIITLACNDLGARAGAGITAPSPSRFPPPCFRPFTALRGELLQTSRSSSSSCAWPPLVFAVANHSAGATRRPSGKTNGPPS